MKEAIIRYKNPRTLKILKDIAEYFDFSISVAESSEPGRSKKLEQINGVAYTPGDNSVNITELSKIFTGKNLDAKQLRSREWQRKK
jgi:hypothetical protein